MFGKPKDIIDNRFDDAALDEFFGDEAAADHSTQLDVLRTRVAQVEGQISSQFTSMAAYAQIAQEQIELVRAESHSGVERSERRLIQLIERERSDRMLTIGHAPSAPVDADVASRLATLEDTLTQIKVVVADCLSRQKALADAITALFEPPAHTLPPPTIDGPVGGLSLLY